MKDAQTCPDCGPAPTSHSQAYFSVLIDRLFLPFNQIMIAVRRNVVAPVLLPLKLDRLALPIMKFLVKTGFGTINEQPDEQNSSRALALWESADKLGIKIYEFRLFRRSLETFVAFYKNDYKFYYELPRPNKPLSQAFWWMDDKPTMRRVFAKNGIPVAKGDVCFGYKYALEVFRDIGGEVIVKPSQGSRSRHTHIHIDTEEKLYKAFVSAKQLSPFVIVEQQLKGQIYRATVVGGKLAGVISRNPPFIYGDGSHTVRQLVSVENQNPKRQDDKLFHRIQLDAEAEKELARQKLSLDSVPVAGQMVLLSDKVSRGVGAVTIDYTDQTHPDNVAVFEKVAQVLDDSLVGIDFIVEDISKSWKDQKLCGVIECNSAPFIDLHHYPYQGQARDVSAELWRLVFPVQD